MYIEHPSPELQLTCTSVELAPSRGEKEGGGRGGNRRAATRRRQPTGGKWGGAPEPTCSTANPRLSTALQSQRGQERPPRPMPWGAPVSDCMARPKHALGAGCGLHVEITGSLGSCWQRRGGGCSLQRGVQARCGWCKGVHEIRVWRCAARVGCNRGRAGGSAGVEMQRAGSAGMPSAFLGAESQNINPAQSAVRGCS